MTPLNSKKTSSTKTIKVAPRQTQKTYQAELQLLTQETLKSLIKFCSEINDHFVLKKTNEVTIPDLAPSLLPRPAHQSDFTESRLSQEYDSFLERNRYVIFLEKNAIVERHDRPTGGLIKIWLNTSNWEKFYKELIRTKSYQELRSNNQKTGKTYTVTLNPNNEVLINGVLFSKPHPENENLRTIRYLIQNANRQVTKIELREKVGTAKELRKIVENLGFGGDRLRVFFHIIKDNTILFRNPVTPEILKEFGLKSLPIQRLKK